MPRYASVASSSRDPSVVNAEVLLPNNAADYNLESCPGFVRNITALECLPLRQNSIIPVTSCPRSSCFLFSQ